MAHDSAHTDGGHGHGDHDHPSFLAHHFDDPEQQFDSGKLGMWLFLVTEVLFFSGMFCAYALYRSRNPEVFTFASQFLNETLGAFNTGVLLFSSLSMAWGVRCAQLRQRTGLVISLAITLGCAAIFLGVKAIEYTHKWDLGLLPAGSYVSQYSLLGHHEGLPSWLATVSLIPAMCVVGFAVWYVATIVRGEKRLTEIAGPMLVTSLCYFVGVFIGIAFENAEAKAKAAEHGGAAHAAVEHAEGHSEEAAGGHAAGDAHTDGAHADEKAHADGEAHEEGKPHDDGDSPPAAGEPATTDQSHNSTATAGVRLVSASTEPAEPMVPGAPTVQAVDQPGGAGLFFSIYYCMTGVHAVHILGGMLVLTWLLIRATKDQFNEQYFGPVDYVGLYWHLVDLIWIYLFPLLYLIK